MAKRLTYDVEAREALRSGVNQLARAVKVTLGPRGKNVVIEQGFGAPTVTKDGVAVAEEVELKKDLENIGAQMVKQAASKTSDVAGDGTTTATVLGEAIFEEALKNLAAGADAMALRRGVEKAVRAITNELGELSRPVKGREDIAFVGAIAANNDREIGEQIADAMEKVGKDGIITVEEGQGLETTVDLVEGMQFQGKQTAAHHLRRPRRRSTGHARGQQAARCAEVRRCEGARLRRPPQGDAGRYRHADRRTVHYRGTRHRP